MKTLAFILSVFILLLATIPCCLADDCLAEASTEQNSPQQQEPGSDLDCGLCSPFFQCHSCSGFAVVHAAPKVAFFFFPEIPCYPAFNQDFVSVFSPSIWQPPKIA